MSFLKTVWLFGIVETIKLYLLFPIWLVWHHVFFLPTLKRKVIEVYCGGDKEKFEPAMLEKYAAEQLNCQLSKGSDY